MPVQTFEAAWNVRSVTAVRLSGTIDKTRKIRIICTNQPSLVGFRKERVFHIGVKTMYGERLSVRKVSASLLLCLPLLVWCGDRMYRVVRFDIECSGHLKRAADANSVELAVQEMETVVEYLEGKRMTSGYTSIFFRSPDEDVGFWYKNLKSARDELSRVEPETSSLERTNILMKLRETLVDEGTNGVTVTVPAGITVFPYNTLYCVWGVLSAIAFCAGLVLSVMISRYWIGKQIDRV
jgi:hypothetical protein